MSNKHTHYERVLSLIPAILISMVLLLMFLNGGSQYLSTSVLPTNNNASTAKADLYIAQNYQAQPGQQGEVELKVGKTMNKVAGIQFTVSYPVNSLSMFDASVLGLPTGSFLVIKNTNTPGSLIVSMAQATGVNLAADSAVAKLSVEVKNNTAQGTQIPLTLSNISLIDENGMTLPATIQNGKIMVVGTAVVGGAYIETVTPDFASPSQDTPVAIKLKNFAGTVASVKLGTNALTGFTYMNNEVRTTVPKGLSAGLYNLVIVDSAGNSMEKIGAFTVVDQAEGLTVDETASFFSPGKVKNDNNFSTTLWVKVDDLRGVEDIQYVDVNLQNLGGPASTRLTSDKIVDKSQWFFLSGIKVPPTVSTSATPYPVTITATNRVGKVAKGIVKVTVTNDVESNVKPVVRQAYTVPPFLTNNGKVPFSVLAYVTDDDGAEKLTNVVVDLSVVGEGTKTMVKDGNAVGNGFWFKTEGAKVSTQVREGDYKAKIMASNMTGDTGEGEVILKVSSKLSAPSISPDAYVAPARVPADNTTPFAVYALVEDPDGGDNIDKVAVSFNDLGLAPKEMTKGAAFGDGNWYELQNLKIPTTVLKGEHEIIISATDKEGNVGIQKERFLVVSVDDVRNAPKVESDRSYATPVLVANDGNTTVNLYTFVTDPDGAGDIVSADVDLREMGLKPVNRMLEDQVQDKGKWFKFTTKIPPIVAPSSEPYKLKVYATDKSGAVAQGTIDLRIASENPGSVLAPRMEAAVSIAPNKIELVFDKELDARTVGGAGDNFSIKDRNDIKKSLSVREATVNTRGNVVILTTSEQEENKPYTVQVDTRIKDLQGTSLRANYGDKAEFRGFKVEPRMPSIRLLTSTGPTALELTFWEPIKPSSVSPDGSDFVIFETTDSRQGIEVTDVHFKDETTLLLTTEPQKYGANYTMSIRNITSRGGIALATTGVETFFKGFLSALVGDLNFDSKVDFIDFTIFADAYRKARGYGSSSNANGYLNLVPPDTVPVISNTNSNPGNSNVNN